MLDEVGIIWEARENLWEEGFVALEQFKAREGHCNVPRPHVEGDLRLGQWVSVQRNNSATMSTERKQRLDEIGFGWKVLDSVWEDGFAALQQFKAREGHCRVLGSHIEGSFKLAAWVRRQRATKSTVAKDTMSAERKKQLDEVGFVWLVQ